MAGSLLAEAFVSIGANTQPLVAGLAVAKTAASGFGSVMKTAFGPIGLLISGALAVKGLVSELIDGETEANNIASALRTTGQEVDGNLSKFDDFANGMEKITTVSAGAINGIIAVGLNMGIPAEKMEDASKAAIGLSKAYGIDLTTAMEMIAKEQQGVATGLNKAIPQLAGVEDQTKRLAIISEAAGRGFEQEQESTNTLGGSFKVLQNTLATLAGDIGTLLAPALHAGGRHRNPACPRSPRGRQCL